MEAENRILRDKEELVHAVDAISLFPPGRVGRPITMRTFYRYADHSRPGPHLETVSSGGRLYTSREAIRRFLAEYSAYRSARPKKSREREAPEQLRTNAEKATAVPALVGG